MDVEIRVSASAEKATHAAAELLAQATERGGHVALSGGSTPRPAYEAAARLVADWSRVELWWADERCGSRGAIATSTGAWSRASTPATPT